MLNYRKKTTAASLAGLNLERPIQVRTIFCYIFHFSCGLRKSSKPLWHSVAPQKIKWTLELGHLALRRTGSCSLAIRVKNALKKIQKCKTVDSKTQDDDSVIALATFSPISLICVCEAQMCGALPVASSQKSNSWTGRPTAHWSAVAKWNPHEDCNQFTVKCRPTVKGCWIALRNPRRGGGKKTKWFAFAAQQ